MLLFVFYACLRLLIDLAFAPLRDRAADQAELLVLRHQVRVLRILYILRRTYGLEDRFTRLRRHGLLTLEEVSQLLGADPSTVKIWATAGHVASHIYNDKGHPLFERSGPSRPATISRRPCSSSSLRLPPTLIDSRGLGRTDWLKAGAWLVLAEVRDHAMVSNAVMPALDMRD